MYLTTTYKSIKNDLHDFLIFSIRLQPGLFYFNPALTNYLIGFEKFFKRKIFDF